jgi:hypothetical protein
MEHVLSFLYCVQATGQTYRIIRWSRLPQVAGWLFRRLGRPALNSYALQFLPHRAAFAETHQSLGIQFNDIATVWACWPVGAGFYDTYKNVHIVKRLILPNPESKLVEYYFKSIGQEHACNFIRSTTHKAKQSGAEVKWIDSFLFNSMTIADQDKPMGWVHVESVLSHRVREKRFGYIIFKDRSQESMKRLVNIFLQIWEDAKEPGVPLT